MQRFCLFVILAFIGFSCSQLCGLTGEDDFNVDSISFNYNQFGSPPHWIFTNKNSKASCTPRNTPSGDANFVKKSTVTYYYNCTVANLSVVNSVVSSLFNFSFSDTECSCNLPATPKGQYLNGYALTLNGHFTGVIDETVALDGPCSITPLYQSNPLQVGQTFSQVFVLNAAAGLGTGVMFLLLCLALSMIM